jgi:FkbM family methyltransferase
MQKASTKNTLAAHMKVADFECTFDVHIHPQSELLSNIIRERGRYSHNDLIIMHTLMHKGDFVVDVGANIGWYTLFFSAFVGLDGLVLAIEPEKKNLAVLRRNILKNSIDNTAVFPGAVSEARGKGQLFHSRENSGDHMLDVTEEVSFREHTDVFVDTLDRLIAKYGKGRLPAFIKIDAQGSEPKILRGAREALKDYQPVIMIEYSPAHMYQCGMSGFEIFAFIESYHYIPLRQLGDGEERLGGKLLELLTPTALLRYHEELLASGLGIDILLLPPQRMAEIAPYVYNL